MSIPRITPQVIAEYGVAAEPDVLSGTPAQNKAVFDRLVREKVAVSLNALLDAWDAASVFEDYQATRNYLPLNKVIYKGATYECLAACTGVTPATGSYWRRISAVSDMDATVYDPQNRKTDIFAYATSLTDTNRMTLRAEMSTLMERGLYDPQNKKTDIFNYTDTSSSNVMSMLRTEMSTLLERGIYDPQKKKTDIYAYVDTAVSNVMSMLRTEMSTLLERGIYDPQKRKTDIFAYIDAKINALSQS